MATSKAFPAAASTAFHSRKQSLLPPVEPSKIVCVGRNYRAHAAELGNGVPDEPLLFFKPPSSLLPPGGTILRPKVSERTDYEGELAVVMARRCHQLPEGEDVRPYILGYTCLNDFTARDLQKKEPQWVRGKGFDTFCPVGPVVADGVNIDPWVGVQVETRVNGEVRQSGNTRFYFPARSRHPLHFADHDLGTRRPDRYRHSRRHCAGAGRRCDRGFDRKHWSAA
jgi:2-keto-4-pentenoate hydratase/2-oxohepta-3-ene-1,7-dioic acid hydratase in catechol pathway